jgi:L-fucono-1,5-lactonase
MIDAHQHFWKWSPAAHPWIDDSMAALRRDFLPADLEPLLRASGFTHSIAVQATQTVDETRWLLDLADRHPFLAAVVGWVDLRADSVVGDLAALAAHPKLRGVRHVVQSEPDDRFLLRPDFQRGVAALGAHGLVYEFLVVPRQLPAAVELAARFPEQPFVLDHLGKPEVRARRVEPWATHVRALARHRNVACKLSGLVTEADWTRWSPADLAPFLDVALEAFAPDRLMIGSDWPVCTLAGAHANVVRVIVDWASRLSPRERDAVLRGTATRVYGLDRAATSPARASR